jgi:hypothetical protein
LLNPARHYAIVMLPSLLMASGFNDKLYNFGWRLPDQTSLTRGVNRKTSTFEEKRTAAFG